MAKDILLGRKPAPAQQELLDRAAGKKPTVIPTPPPARPLPPGAGNPPLPAGRIVQGIAPSALTPQERQALESVGWTEASGVPIPNNMAELLEQERQRRQAEEVVLPVPPGTPPVAYKEPVDIETLPPTEQARILGVMRAAFDQQQAAQAAAQQTGMVRARQAQVPGLEAAMRAAQAAVGPSREPLVEDDRPAPQPAPQPAPATAPAPAPAAEAPRSETGADVRPAACPHCGFDLARPDVPEPPYTDKIGFVHAMLGQKPFVKTYELFGGQVEATFRTLTTREIDVIYRQAWRDRDRNQLVTDADYWERINRYRLFLQLLEFRSLGPDGFAHDLPDGLSREDNPNCTAVWKVEDAGDDAESTPLPAIEEYLVGNVLRTEALFRVVNSSCNQFNRLVAKLEAMADNSDFWRPTEAPS